MTASDGDHHEEIGVTRARGALRGVHAFWILVISFTLAALALFFAWMWRAPDFQQVHGQGGADPAAATSFQAPQTPPPTQLPGGSSRP